ncbi:LLM class flavin-dependent oxidoreductase [Rhizobium rhizogenes]|uniref:LLM class flavin-dependent oxidoreductase n=1 Tax=Rhizobium rhizogenes TaxID=359 RepID=UPI0015734CDD|nr:LLM class flavin-dependent oxidoreductase [Rhizobium rhizogenes]NTF66044.1 LLM class flavin-dependent oxidoreductase [Rhizobium rhizogenes]NTG97429.1 LLM class flavin-dependent oxidoreductase [Rhizobium rhizogenes]
MARRDKLILGAFLQTPGQHTAGWRYPRADAQASLDIDAQIAFARTAERGLFHAMFIADTLPFPVKLDVETLSYSARVVDFEPVTLLSALAVATSRIGLVGTVTTTYYEPYFVARQFASLDHLSKGRAGWNVVTSSNGAEALNYSRREHPPHALRYQRATEFVDIVKGLWDSWDDDAFLFDKEGGRFFSPDKVHLLDHSGQHFKVRGPLAVSRPPQGHPVIVQAGSSDTGRNAAASFADVVFTAQSDLPGAIAFYDDVRARVAAAGRDPDHVAILPGVTPVVARTRSEAQEKYEQLQDLLHPVAGLAMLSGAAGADLSKYPIDGPLPAVPPTEGDKTRQELLVAHAERTGLTIRELYRWLASGYNTIVGTPSDIADHFEHWFKTGGADGFNVRFSYLPGDLDDFVDLVIPELQRRGLYHEAYEGTTLRDNLQIPRPPSRYSRIPGSEIRG